MSPVWPMTVVVPDCFLLLFSLQVIHWLTSCYSVIVMFICESIVSNMLAVTQRWQFL